MADVTDDWMDDDEGASVEGASAAGRAATPPQVVDKRTLVKRIAAASGTPPTQARKLLDVALAEIAAAIDSGAVLSLPPLGKLRPTRKSDQGGTAIHTLRLRRSPAGAEAEAEAEAEADEDGAEPKPKSPARAKPGSAARRRADPPQE